jgi:hypothetical protein
MPTNSSGKVGFQNYLSGRLFMDFVYAFGSRSDLFFCILFSLFRCEIDVSPKGLRFSRSSFEQGKVSMLYYSKFPSCTATRLWGEKYFFFTWNSWILLQNFCYGRFQMFVRRTHWTISKMIQLVIRNKARSKALTNIKLNIFYIFLQAGYIVSKVLIREEVY